MDFRRRLVSTLRAVRPLFDVPGLLVVGSEVPNLLEPGAASTLVVSLDLDLGVPVGSHAVLRERLGMLRGFRQSEEEPSVWLPASSDLLEVNFIGIDHRIVDPAQTYVLDDPDLPLLVFGPVGLLVAGPPVTVEDMQVPVPRLAGLLLEKLLTDRTAEKGVRDLLVVAGLLPFASPDDDEEVVALYGRLPDDLRHAARSNLTVLSLLDPIPGMPDPRPLRGRISGLLASFETLEGRFR